LNTFKILWLAIGATIPDRKVSAMRSTKGEQTRAAIAEAALRMFREQGYEATTMRAIAKEVGVPEDLPAHRFDRAARRAPDRAGPGARGAVADPAAATGRRRRAVL